VRARIEPGLTYPAHRYLQALQIRPDILRRFVQQVFSRCDVLHAPVLAFPVPSRAETDVRDGPSFPTVLSHMTWCTSPINYLGLPGLAVPCGFTTNGLPCAFQLVGRPFAERDLFRIGAAYEQASAWTERVPAL
jgi:aspartyl-tRNA(Asn)/glutamyl-tRNA(Gln) amidotransferase subunit A